MVLRFLEKAEIIMDTTRRSFLQHSAGAGAGVGLAGLPAGVAQGGTSVGAAAQQPRPADQPYDLDGAAIARRHTILRTLPTPDFFEGMLLGNGDLGVCVTLRPDALGLHIGKLDVWDVRVSEDHAAHVLPFREVLRLWKEASDAAKRAGKPDQMFLETSFEPLMSYQKKVRSSYAQIWPRPWPCGSVYVHWDARFVTLVRQTLDPSDGLYRAELRYDNLRGQRSTLQLYAFVNWDAGHLAVYTDGPAPFLSVAYYPRYDTRTGLPAPQLKAAEGRFSCYQRLPVTAPRSDQPMPPPEAPVSPEDKSFALEARVGQGGWSAAEVTETGRDPRVLLKPASGEPQPFRLDVVVVTPRDHADNVKQAAEEATRLAAIAPTRLRQETVKQWREYWSASAVLLEDKELERWWYQNQYFLACCLREGKVAPGLFANWSKGEIGTAWHGDYHMNYNTQQVFWGVFSSNHVSQHLPYVELVEMLVPIAERNAREVYEMPGAYFPHSAYPVPSTVDAYPVPPWNLEMCETPWTVQSLWWHYAYTLDTAYLERVYPILRAGAQFIAAYVKKHADGKYHFDVTVSPENWGCTVDFKLNRDCIIDIAMAQFLMAAVVKASEALGADEKERSKWVDVRDNLTAYPTVKGPHGEVWLDVPNAPAEWVYNVPVTLAPVFPGEQVGLGIGEQHLEIARRTARTVRLEGGNDVAYQPLIRARLGMLELNWFKNEVRYSLLPNGVAFDRVRQVGGRYRDSTDFDFMKRMGFWTECLGVPAVINECLMQSYTGVIRLFPNARGMGRSSFRSLRAMGAHLVSAQWDGSAVLSPVWIHSEKGAPVELVHPWGRGPVRVTSARQQGGGPISVQVSGGAIRFATEAGAAYKLERAG
jgi:alpha-L-fucosidase 2